MSISLSRAGPAAGASRRRWSARVAAASASCSGSRKVRPDASRDGVDARTSVRAVDQPRGLVIVVEDEPAISDLVRRYLTAAGFGVHLETTVAGAFERRTPPASRARAARRRPAGRRGHGDLPSDARRRRLDPGALRHRPRRRGRARAGARARVPTTTSPNRSRRASWSRASRPSCAAAAHRPGRGCVRDGARRPRPGSRTLTVGGEDAPPDDHRVQPARGADGRRRARCSTAPSSCRAPGARPTTARAAPSTSTSPSCARSSASNARSRPCAASATARGVRHEDRRPRPRGSRSPWPPSPSCRPCSPACSSPRCCPGAREEAVRAPLARQVDLLARLPRLSLRSDRLDRVTEVSGLTIGVVSAARVSGAAVALTSRGRRPAPGRRLRLDERRARRRTRPRRGPPRPRRRCRRPGRRRGERRRRAHVRTPSRRARARPRVAGRARPGRVAGRAGSPHPLTADRRPRPDGSRTASAGSLCPPPGRPRSWRWPTPSVGSTPPLPRASIASAGSCCRSPTSCARPLTVGPRLRRGPRRRDRAARRRPPMSARRCSARPSGWRVTSPTCSPSPGAAFTISLPVAPTV